MTKSEIQFTAVKVNPEIDPSGGYSLHVSEMPTIDDETVYEEVRLNKTLPLSADLLHMAVKSVLQTMAAKTAADGRPRRIGDLIKCYVTLRGKVTSPYSPYNDATCSTAVLFLSMKGLDKKVDLDRVRFVNSRTGTRVTIDRITYQGSAGEVGVIKQGTAITVNGLNLQYITGDSVTIVWKNSSGVEQTATLTPSTSDVTRMTFSWPSALEDVAVGTEVEFRFLTRGGVADSDPQPNTKKVTIIA